MKLNRRSLLSLHTFVSERIAKGAAGRKTQSPE